MGRWGRDAGYVPWRLKMGYMFRAPQRRDRRIRVVDQNLSRSKQIVLHPSIKNFLFRLAISPSDDENWCFIDAVVNGTGRNGCKRMRKWRSFDALKAVIQTVCRGFSDKGKSLEIAWFQGFSYGRGSKIRTHGTRFWSCCWNRMVMRKTGILSHF